LIGNVLADCRNVEAKELQLDIEQINARDDRHSYSAAIMDKTRAPSSSGGGKARSARNSKARRSPYQAPPCAAATAACATAETGASKISDDYAAPSCEFGEVVTAAATPGYDYADDVVKVSRYRIARKNNNGAIFVTSNLFVLQFNLFRTPQR
jgi:hypothetical protein